MASSQGIRAGRAFVELFADDTKLVRGLKAAEKRLKAFGAGVQSIGTKLFGLGTAAVAPLLATTNVFASMGDQLAKMSARTGISVESLSELGYAAEQSGADLATLEGGVRKMQKFLVDAAEGSATAEQTLSRLGLSLADTFQSLKDDALAAWQGIGDALAAGDLALAAKILWLALRLEWLQGVAFLQEHWIAVKVFFLSIASETFYGAVGLLVDAWSGLQVAWVETTAFLADAWTMFTSSLTKGWSSAQNFISKGVLRLMKLFDSELDVEAASTILDEDFQRQTAATDRQAQQTIGERDRRRQEQRAQIETERQGAQSEVARMADEDRLARERQNAADLSKTGDALAEARKEWEAALAEAAQKRADVAANTPERTRRAQDDLAGMDDLLSQLADERVSTQGTFNAAAVRGLGGGSAADRTAKATEETAKNTKRLLEQSQHGQLVFT